MANQLRTDLIKWSDDPQRKALILRGEGESGKIRSVSKLALETNRVLITVDLADPDNARICKENSPKEMVAALSSATGKEITGKRSILFLHGIENCPELLPELKNINKEIPDLPLIVTGSGIDSLIRKYEADLPAGRVTTLFYKAFSFGDLIKEITPGSDMRGYGNRK